MYNTMYLKNLATFAMLKHFAEFVFADVLRKGYHVCVIINAGEKKSWIKVLPM